MRKFVLLMSAAALLAGCSQAEDSAEDTAAAPVTADPGSFGPVMVTLPDGTQMLNVSTDDGVFYSAPFEGEPGAWTTDGDQLCVDPAGDEPPFCFTAGPVQEDGTFENTSVDGEPLGGTWRRLTGSAEGGPAGSYFGTMSDGSNRLVIWTEDGRTYGTASPQRGAWRVVDGKRCGKLDTATEENCGTPGVIAEDGSWTGTPDDPTLEPVTVMPLN